MKDDTQYLVRDSVGQSAKSEKILKIFSIICVVLAISFGTYKVLSHEDNEVGEREYVNEEINPRSKVDDSPFVAIPGVTCGKHYDPSESPFSSNVIGGGQAVNGMFTWHASLIVPRDSKDFIYAATIISDRWLITEILEIEAENLYIRVGSLSRNSGGTKHLIEKVLKGGIGLIKTKTPILFSNNVQPICLPPTGLCLATGSEVWTSGYGPVENLYGWQDDDKLIYQKTFLASFNYCKDFVRNQNISTSTTCNTTPFQTMTCNGDPGTPLSARINGIWYSHGSLAGGYTAGCSIRGYGAFHRTAYSTNWILEQTEGEIVAEYARQTSASCEDDGLTRSDEQVWDDIEVTWMEAYGSSVNPPMPASKFIITKNQSFSSQNTEFYEPNTRKQWKIVSTNGQNFTVRFNSFDIQGSSPGACYFSNCPCDNDKVKIVINDADNEYLRCPTVDKSALSNDSENDQQSKRHSSENLSSTAVESTGYNSRSLKGYKYDFGTPGNSYNILDDVWTGSTIRIFFETDDFDQRTGFNFTVATDHEVTISIYDQSL